MLVNVISSVAQRQAPPPPHLLVLTLKLPHFLVTQSRPRSFEPSSSFDQASPGTRPGVFQTTSNWPSARTSPMNTGLGMWCFASIFEVPPVRFGSSMPGSASMTLSGSVDFTFSTALTHIWKPTTCASIGSLVTRFGFLVKAFHLAMNSEFDLFLIDSK